MERPVSFKETPDGRFPYLDIGSETHGRPSFRLWVSGRLITRKVRDKQVKHYVVFPAKAKIKETARGTRVLVPDENYICYDIYVPCGYRGCSSFKILEPKDAKAYRYSSYRSPRGNLGISFGALVVVSKGTALKYSWRRAGRTYGNPKEGITFVMPDGKTQELDSLEDGLEELEQLKQLLD